jgi:hypothetical protein
MELFTWNGDTLMHSDAQRQFPLYAIFIQYLNALQVPIGWLLIGGSPK